MLIPGGVGTGTQGFEGLGHVRHDVGELLGLGRGNPFEAEALGLEAKVFQHQVNAFGSGLGFYITFQVMAFTQVSPTYDDTIGALGEGVDDEIGVDHTGAHDPDDAAVGWVLDPGDPGQVGAGVGAPVAEKGDDQGLELI
jgi:hypothetical protein